MPEPDLETTRLVAHVLLDAVSAWKQGLDRQVNQASMDLALQRVLDVGGVTVARLEDDEVLVDVSSLMGAATQLTFYFCDLVAGLSKQERETIVTVARWALDNHFGQPVD